MTKLIDQFLTASLKWTGKSAWLELADDAAGIEANVFETEDEARSALQALGWKEKIMTVREAAERGALPLPPGRTGESAYYACEGPAEQVRADLRRIIEECDGWPTAEAKALREEAEEFLAERE